MAEEQKEFFDVALVYSLFLSNFSSFLTVYSPDPGPHNRLFHNRHKGTRKSQPVGLYTFFPGLKSFRVMVLQGAIFNNWNDDH